MEIAALGDVGPHNADGMGRAGGVFVHFNDALEPVRADLRAATKNTAKSGVAKEHLEKLQAGLMWQKLEEAHARPHREDAHQTRGRRQARLPRTRVMYSSRMDC